MHRLGRIRAMATSPVELRLLQEYGAMFLTTATPPPGIVFANESEVLSFQRSLATGRALIGEYEIELQAMAIDALLQAQVEAEKRGSRFTPRAADSGRRSFEDTVRLWRRNVDRGLEYWQTAGSIDHEIVSRLKSLSAVDQVPIILELELSQQIFFGTYFDRTILSSVAAPGASQHLAMLAFDVAQYQDAHIEAALAAHGWHRTVSNDVPHFTFLGIEEHRLAESGLKRVISEQGERTYCFWVLDL